MTSKTKIWMFSVLGLLVTLVVAFAIYCAYFAIGKKALPGTMVGNVSVAGQTEDQIAAQLAKAQSDLKVTFTGTKDVNPAVTLKDIGYQVDQKKTAAAALRFNSQPLAYFTGLFTNHQVDPSYSVTAEKATKLAQTLSAKVEGAKEAKEPSIKQIAGAAKFEVVPGKDGYGVTKQSLIQGAHQALRDQKDTSFPVQVGTSKPLVSDQDAKGLADRAQTLANSKVVLNVGDKSVSPEAKLIASWVRFPKVQKEAAPDLDDTVIKKWVEEVKKPIEAKKIDGFRYKSSSGKVIKVDKEAKDGVTVTNVKEVSEKIKTDLLAGKPYQGKLETKEEKAKWDEKVIADGAEKLVYMAAPGEKWIDVNLSNFTLTGYEGAKVVKGPFLIVPGKAGHRTVTGTFKIYQRNRTQTMRGADYVTPDVPYIQYFHLGYAIHGAYWRNEFGFDAGAGGSHGCVNISVSDARELWGWSTIGTTVVSHH